MKHLQDPKIKTKAVLKRRANAKVKEIRETKIISRDYNIMASNDGTFVSVNASVTELNKLLKHYKSRQKIKNRYLPFGIYNDEYSSKGKRQYWGFIRFRISL